MNNADMALLVIDMQMDFLTPSSALYVGGGPAIVPAVCRAVDCARSADAVIVHIVRRHRASGIDIDLSRQELFDRSGGLLVAGAHGAEEIPPLNPTPSDLTVIKTRWSAFFGTDLDLLLRRLHIHRLVLTGLQTPNCIRATAMDALSLDYATTVLSDATASQTTSIQASNLADMAAMGIQILTVAQFEETLVR